jgi:hypothetical protein
MKHPFFEPIDFQTLRDRLDLFNILGKNKCVLTFSNRPMSTWGGLKNPLTSTFIGKDSSLKLLPDRIEEESDSATGRFKYNNNIINETSVNNSSNNCNHRLSSSQQLNQMEETKEPKLLKEGYLRKKGLIFNNKRLVRLYENGIFEYYSPSNLKKPKGSFQINQTKILAHQSKNKVDYFKFIFNGVTFKFTVSLFFILNSSCIFVGVWQELT